jgi:ATP-dependent helicase/nuclease subunit A
VHDLLDRIYHEGDLVTRYAQSVGPLLRSQVIGNLEAFIELALNLDAGRYPSLPKFIDALATLKNGAQNDAPDEANIDPNVDAVRILTIHSAKGLEARIVVLMDANGSEAARDDLGILCDWPMERKTPVHFSAFGRKAERGVMRDALFAQEEILKQQEDWNLLYVAATRAKELLIISGVAASRGADDEGMVAQNWYARLLAAPLLDMSDAMAPQERGPSAAPEQFMQAVFAPPSLHSPALLAASSALPVSSVAIDEGIALHALLERITLSPDWPPLIPEATVLARWIECDVRMATLVREQAV